MINVWNDEIYFFDDRGPYLIKTSQSINLQNKLVDWLLYDKDFCHERVNGPLGLIHFRPMFPFYFFWKRKTKADIKGIPTDTYR